MSAGPPPPPHLYPVSSATNGHGPGSGSLNPEHSAARDAEHFRAKVNGVSPSRQPRPYPHLQDLVAKASNEARTPSRNIDKLLERAHNALKNARTFHDFGRPDQAYAEFLIAYELVIYEVPKHRDYPELRTSRSREQFCNELMKKINAESPRYAEIKESIKENNEKFGVAPTSSQHCWPEHSSRPSSSHSQVPYSLRTGPPQSAQRNSLPLPSSNPSSTANPNATYGSHQPRPQSVTTPNGVQSGSAHHTDHQAYNHDHIAQRFAKLRTTAHTSLENQSNGASLEKQYSSNGQRITQYHIPSSAPQTNGSSHRPNVSVNTSMSRDLPNPPSPTYTPSRPPVQPRSSRSSVYTNSSFERPQSYQSSNSSILQHQPRGYELHFSDQRSDASDSPTNPMRRRRKSVNRPQETEISAQRLYDYLPLFNILLVDVRHREEYDSGHIWSRSNMCVEPTALRQNMSAEELQDSLVLSPDQEQIYFARRDEFDLLVYYDQSTPTADWVRGRSKPYNSAMRYLQEALYEFNQEKPLQWAPILLKGGLDAWVDLVGNQALQTSNTAHRVRNQIQKPITRRPVVNMPSPGLDIQRKRHHRDYNPLAPEEERKWRERARSESLVLESQTILEQDAESEQANGTFLQMPSDEDFNRRYPDVAAVESQSADHNVSPPSNNPNPPMVPHYPTPPIPSQPPVPSVPSRPPPTVPRRTYSGVSEKLVSPAAPTTRPPLAPYIPPKLKRLPRTGLHNFGVTCYMNATIQCLSATVPLTAFFLDQQFVKFLQKENWKGSKGLMPELFNTLLRNLWQSHDVDTIRPTNFRKFCARLNKEWGIDRQQDSKEFLEFLVDCLHEDLNINWRRNPLRSLTPQEEAERERTHPFVAAKREWDRYLHRDHSRLTELFAGQHISRLTCNVCRHTSTVYEPFYSISVEIPATSARNIDINDCLRSYCSAETLSGDEVWRCPNCRCEREATKRITITRAPEFLIVHFKRFSAGHSERARKIHTGIDFPLKDFDLEPYMLKPLDSQAREHISKRYGSRELETPQSMKPPYRYDCYAVMRHLGGTIASGHYISLVQDKARNCWREFNDDRVTDFQPSQLPPSKRLQNEQAYIVFYQRSRVME